jgi:hypothetical protein
MFSHSNRPIGKVLSHKWIKTDAGKDALFVTAIVYRSANEDIIAGINENLFHGFSIGARSLGDGNTEHNSEGKLVRNLEISQWFELSLVEEPACEECVITHIEEIKKSKVYVKNPNEAPPGIQIQTGKHGGLYYESENSSKPTEESGNKFENRISEFKNSFRNSSLLEIKSQIKFDVDEFFKAWTQGKDPEKQRVLNNSVTNIKSAKNLNDFDEGILILYTLTQKYLNHPQTKQKLIDDGAEIKDDKILLFRGGIDRDTNINSYTTDSKIAGSFASHIKDGKLIEKWIPSENILVFNNDITTVGYENEHEFVILEENKGA